MFGLRASTFCRATQRALWSLALLCELSMPVGAEEAIPSFPGSDLPPLASQEQLEGDYILGGGDKIKVEDATMGELTVDQTTLTADGSASLPLIGTVYLEGMTLSQAEAFLNEKYSEYYQRPDMNIVVTYMHPIRYYVQGAVQEPGIFSSGKNLKTENQDTLVLGAVSVLDIHYRTMLTDALLLAGGLKYNADMRDVRIRRSFPQEQIIHVNVWELFKNGNTLNDVILHDQDIVEVPELPKDQVVSDPEFRDFTRTNVSISQFPVNVLGAVQQPGSYTMKNQDNILTAIAQAGGMTELADEQKVYILRSNASGQVFKRQVKLSDKLFQDPKLAGEAQSAVLLPEDVVFVDESPRKKAGIVARGLFDRATGAVMLPFFNRLVDF